MLTLMPTPLRSAPIRSTPVRSAPPRCNPFHSAPLHSTPLRSGPLRSAPLTVLLLKVTVALKLQLQIYSEPRPFLVPLHHLQQGQKYFHLRIQLFFYYLFILAARVASCWQSRVHQESRGRISGGRKGIDGGLSAKKMRLLKTVFYLVLPDEA